MAPELLRPGEDIKPDFSLSEAEEVLFEIFGLKSLSVEQLNGYDDKNYKVVVDERWENRNLERVCKEGYVLKIMNSLDSGNLEFVDGCNALLKFLEQTNIGSPRLVPTKKGDFYSIKFHRSKKHVIRLLEYIPGTLLHQIRPTEDLFYEMGQFLAKLDLTMKNFHHRVYDTHRTIWCLDSVPKLRDFIFAVQNEQRKQTVLKIIEEFDERVLSIRNDLEAGMVHGDFNEQNVLIEEVDGRWKVKAILDFGDSQYSCYLYELAIAVTYMMLQGRSVKAGGHVIAGYCSVKPIGTSEFGLLKICVCARLCQSLVIGAYTHLQQPQNLYLLTTAAAGWELLDELLKEKEERTLATWMSIIEKYNPK